MRLLLALAALATATSPVLATGVERSGFRYTRTLGAANGGGPVVFEPDGRLFAHARPGFSDLRILDADGEQVPWRRRPVRERTGPERVRVLNSGREGRYAVALLDLGPRRRVRDHVLLDVPQRGFVGRAVVLAADRREGPFTRLSATGIYDIRGASRARSTVAVFGPSDARYLRVRATSITRIAGATVSGAGTRPRLIQRRTSVARAERGMRTAVTLDLGRPNLPVDELRIAARTPRYERSVVISGSDDGRRFIRLAGGRLFAFAGSRSAPIAVDARQRYLRIEVDNGDDRPLRGIRVGARSRSRALLVEGGRPRPYVLLYGNPRARAPSYDFARLPAIALGLQQAVGVRLGAERVNPRYEPPPDDRSFTARNPRLVQAALALAALALAAVGLLALRTQRAPPARGSG